EPEDQTVAKIASIYNFTGRENVNNYGARVEDVYNNKLWDNPYEGSKGEVEYYTIRAAYDKLQYMEEGSYVYIPYDPFSNNGVLFKVIDGKPTIIDYPTYDSEADNPPLQITDTIFSAGDQNSNVNLILPKANGSGFDILTSTYI